MKETIRPDSRRTRVTTMVAPSGMHPKKVANSRTRIDTGAVILRNARASDFRHEFVPMDQILQDYRDHKMAQ